MIESFLTFAIVCTETESYFLHVYYVLLLTHTVCTYCVAYFSHVYSIILKCIKIDAINSYVF